MQDVYKYNIANTDCPFAGEVQQVVEASEPANFSTQGEAVGKTKGRKKRCHGQGDESKGQHAELADAIGGEPYEGADAAEAAEPQPKRKPRAKATTSRSDSKPASKRARVKKTADPVDKEAVAKPDQAQVESGAELQQGEAATPEGGHEPVQSEPGSAPAVDGKADPAEGLTNPFSPPAHVGAGHVYSNAYRKALAEGKDKESAKESAKRASLIFRTTKLCYSELVGSFAAAPRKSKTPPKGGSAAQGGA